jgi:hypothetical protein
MLLYHEYFRTISKNSIKRVKCYFVRKFSGRPVLENCLLAPAALMLHRNDCVGVM